MGWRADQMENSASVGLQSGGRYIAVMLSVLLGLIGIFFLLLIPSVSGAPGKHASESSKFIYYFSKRKLDISNRQMGPRLMIFGGSGSLYSVRAAQLDRELGVPAINWSTHAGLGLDYILFNAKRVLRHGDVAVLILEYEHFVLHDPSWTLADFVLPSDLDYIQSLSINGRISLLKTLAVNEYGWKIYDRWHSAPVDGSARLEALNDAGDLVINQKQDQKDFHRASLDRYTRMDAAASAINPLQLQKLAAFIGWCRSQGIHVVAGFPAFLDFPEYHSSPSKGFFTAIEQFYENLGVPMLGTAEDFFFPKSMFFDTWYHMSAEGATVMTAKLLAQLMRLDLRADIRCCSAAEIRQNRVNRRENWAIDFSADGYPGFVDRVNGLSLRESWGRWSDGKRVRLEFYKPLPRRFTLQVILNSAFGPNAQGEISVRVGEVEKKFRYVGPDRVIEVPFDLASDASYVEIVPPKPVSPKALGLSEDSRLLGVGLKSMRVIE
jgi:hypothetical protein